MRISLILGFVFLFSLSAHAYLKIDTNQLMLMPSVTNINVVPVPEPMVPSSYLKTGVIEFQEPETTLRRFDIIYFVAVPITFYLTLNLLLILNTSFIGNDPGLINQGTSDPLASQVQFRYILLNTLLIPLFVAWTDYKYMKNHSPQTATPPLTSGLNLGVNLVSISF